jgi:flavin reductase (DIM6/NTAB) family NADH-FMN oxidoreductase RutF
MIFCRVARHIVHGTHGIFIADVEEVRYGTRPIKPLVYLNRAALPIPCAPAQVSH